MNVGFVSFMAQWQFDTLSAERLKLLTMLFDRLLFSSHVPTFAAPFGTDEPEDIPPLAMKKLSELWRLAEETGPRHDIYTLREKWPWTNAPDDLTAAARSAMSQLGWSDPANEASSQSAYEAYKISGYAMSDIVYWQTHLRKTTFIGEKIGQTIFENLQKNQTKNSDVLEQVDVPIANLTGLTWSDVLELRRSPFLCSFREKYNSLLSSGRLSDLVEQYYKALEFLADQARPDTGAKVLEAVLGSLPIPLLNPFSLVGDARDIWKAEEMRRELGWVFFLRDIRKRTHIQKPLDLESI